MLQMALEALVQKYLNVAELAKDASNAEVVVDGVLTHFGLDYYGVKLGAERLYTMGIADHKFRSVLSKAEDLGAICDWFKNKLGLSDEDIAAVVEKNAKYAAGMLMLGKQYAEMGHKICSKKYFELAAASGCAEAAEILGAEEKAKAYARSMVMLGEQYAEMGHKICSKKYFELAAAKGCPKAAAKLAEIADAEYAEQMLLQGKKSLAMGHAVSGKKYLELAAGKGNAEAAAKLADMKYAAAMLALGEQYAAMGHKICSKKYFELAAAKGCPKAAAKLQ